MKCSKCNTEFEGNFCPECGEAIKTMTGSTQIGQENVQANSWTTLKAELEQEKERIKKRQNILDLICMIPFSKSIIVYFLNIWAIDISDLVVYIINFLITIALPYFVIASIVSLLFGKRKRYKEIDAQLTQIRIAEETLLEANKKGGR